jgi:hypothetical protein
MSYPRTRAGTLIMPPNSAAAAGNSQATATLMPSNHVSVSGADGTKGVRLPAPSRGKVCLVYNEHATLGLKVYPHVGGDINDGTQNAAITIEGKTLALFWALDLTTWAARYTADT